MSYIILFLSLALGYYFFILRPGRLDFWKLASKYPDKAYDLFINDPAWQVFAEKPDGGYRQHLQEGDWTGPFYLSIPRLGWKNITIYGKVPDFEITQNEFINSIG